MNLLICKALNSKKYIQTIKNVYLSKHLGFVQFLSSPVGYSKNDQDPYLGLTVSFGSVEIPRIALPGLGAQAVPTSEGPQRGFYWWNWILQSLPHGGQLPAGQIHLVINKN